MALTFAIILSANAQTRKMSMNELFELIGQNNKSIKASRSAAAAAIEGIKAAKSERLPDVNVQLSASYIGNAIMMDRDFSDWQNLDSPHWGNQFVRPVQVPASQRMLRQRVRTRGGTLNGSSFLSPLTDFLSFL